MINKPVRARGWKRAGLPEPQPWELGLGGECAMLAAPNKGRLVPAALSLVVFSGPPGSESERPDSVGPWWSTPADLSLVADPSQGLISILTRWSVPPLPTEGPLHTTLYSWTLYFPFPGQFLTPPQEALRIDYLPDSA